MRAHQLQPGDLAKVITHVLQGAIDVLGPVTNPQSVHQSKFSMGTVLGLIAVFDRAGLSEFDASFLAPDVVAVRDKVSMVLDEEVDTAYPQRWIGKVTVHTTDGRVVTGRVAEPKGDPGNTLSRAEIEQKARSLAAYGQGATDGEMDRLIAREWAMSDWARVEALLP